MTEEGRTTSPDERRFPCLPSLGEHCGDCHRCTPVEGRTLSCANGCDLPDDERLFDITGEKFHAVQTREAKGWESYNGPEPAEYEPCGPVTSGRSLSSTTTPGGTVPLYRKKPVVIEAMRFTEANGREVADWCGGKYKQDVKPSDQTDVWRGVLIPTLEGTMTASVGDYVIRGVHGEFYPCKPDIFDATYEAVDG